MWLLNALDNSYNTETTLAVKFQNFPGNKVLLKDLPQEFTILVSGYGYNLLRYKMQNDPIPIVINLEKYKLAKLNKSEYDYYLKTSQFLPIVEKRFKGEIQVVGILPDTLYFHFTEMVNKKVPVKANVEYSLGNQFMLNGEILVNPDSVLISGPNQIVTETEYLETDYYDYGNLTGEFQRNIKLKRIERLKFDVNRVSITIPIEKFSEKLIKIDVQAIHVPDSIQLTLIPRKVELLFNVPLSLYNKIGANDFKVEADYKFQYNGIIPLNVTSTSKAIKNWRLSPNEVQCIIEEKN